jgi:glucosamine-6-phosphate deaminase
MVNRYFNIVEAKNEKDVSQESARMVIEAVRKKPNLVLGLATGKTMVPFYRELVKLKKKERVSFRGVRTFNLDEYYCCNCKHKKSFRTFMEKNLFSKLDIPKKNIYFLDGMKEDYDKECDRYEKAIRKVGGIDLQILGIGRNGHIGFNEPGSSGKSKTRRVKLSKSTRKANASFFGSKDKVPKYALTMGIKTILDSKKILLLALGERKADAIAKTISCRITRGVPGSFLCRHKNVSFVMDSKAGSRTRIFK